MSEQITMEGGMIEVIFWILAIIVFSLIVFSLIVNNHLEETEQTIIKAKLYGVERKWFESNESLRKRTMIAFGVFQTRISQRIWTISGLKYNLESNGFSLDDIIIDDIERSVSVKVGKRQEELYNLMREIVPAFIYVKKAVSK